MTFTLTTSGAIMLKAGLNANSTIGTSGAALLKWCTDAESTICLLSRYDWVTNFSSVTTNFRGVLSDAVSSLAAMNVINYDMSGYTSRTEAQTMLDVNRDIVNRCVEVLRLKEYQEVMD